MITAVLAGMMIAAQGQNPPVQPQTKTYSNVKLGLEFKYPANWTLRQERLYEVMDIPLASGGSAEVQIFATYFRQSPESWQAVQADMSETLGRTIDRQWQEVILGVPMLLTRVYFVKSGDKMSTLVGLLYSSSPEKLNYRLTAPADKAEEAEEMWRNALSSLRTLTGEVPKPETPLATGAAGVDPPGGGGGTKILEPPKVYPVIKPHKDDKLVNVRAFETDMQLKMPSDWTLTPEGDGYKLTHAGVKGSISLHIDAGSTELAKAFANKRAGETLPEFTKVRLRNDRGNEFAEGGAFLTVVERYGKKDDADLVIIHATGARSQYYWILEYRSGSEADAKSDLKHLNRLYQYLLVEAPQ